MAGKFNDLEAKCKKTIEHFKRDLGRLRGGRANVSILEGITVEYYGSQVPLNQVGLVNAPEARLLTVQVYDGSAVEAVEKAIQQANLGLNPARDGSLVRVPIPALNEERRKDLVKNLHKMAEEGKVTVRNHRREAIDLVKKQEKGKELSTDDARRHQEEIQKLTDKAIAEVETAAQGKEKELMDI